MHRVRPSPARFFICRGEKPLLQRRQSPALLPRVRAARLSDLEPLCGLGAKLDTINLRNDRAMVQRGIETSLKSFAGATERDRSVYQFVYEDPQARSLWGTSKINARIGTPEHPHYFWNIARWQRECGPPITSEILKVDLPMLVFGKDIDGLTEIGGFVVEPEKVGSGLGKALFYARFLYMALHRPRFLDRVISELLPPLRPDGSNAFWECIGGPWTRLPYIEADRLRGERVQFAPELFEGMFFLTHVIEPSAQAVIGVVGDKTKPAAHLAAINGFTFRNHVDPIDAGPHFVAELDEILCVKNLRRGPVVLDHDGIDRPAQKGLVSNPRAPEFCAFVTEAKLLSDSTIAMPAEVASALNVSTDDEIAFMPYTRNEGKIEFTPPLPVWNPYGLPLT